MQGTLTTIEKQGPAATLDTLAAQINEEHHQAEAALNNGLQHALEAGRLLHEAKELCLHGSWLPWLGANFQGTKRTARAYMLVADRLPRLQKQNGNAVANLSFRGALRLTAAPRPAGNGQSCEASDASTSPKWAALPPEGADPKTFMDCYVAFVKGWTDDLRRRQEILRECSIAALKRRLKSYTTVREVLQDHEPASLVRARHRLEREECQLYHLVDTVAKMCNDRLTELQSTEGGADE